MRSSLRLAVRQADSRTKIARWQVCSRYEESAPAWGGAAGF